MWLVVLSALPFTAPFAALDIADLLGGEHTRSIVSAVSGPAASHPQHDDADDVVASDASFPRVHPVTLCGLAPAGSPVARDPMRPAAAFVAHGFFPSHDDVSAHVVALRL
jgi:hypothetical protein